MLIVTPVHNEEASLPSYIDAIKAVLLDSDVVEGHVLFVDDGSSDTSWELIEKVVEADPRFRGIRLARNFGAHVAVSAAMDHADIDPDITVTIACDLQDPPATVLDFVEKWHEGADIVWGLRRTRHEARWRIVASRIFQSALQRWAMPRGSLFTTGGFVLIDRRVLQAVREMREHNRINFALIAWTGFRQAQVPYDRAKRLTGQSSWTFAKMFASFYDAFVGFSSLPIRLMSVAAILSALVAVALAVFLVIQVTFGHHPVPGWTSAVLIPSVFFAIQFTLTAIMGEYLYRIRSEVVRRPTYFISDDTNNPNTAR